MYDGPNVIMEYDDYNESTSGYVHGDNVDEPLVWLPNYATDRYYYHADGLGSIRALTNGDASLVQVINYDSFGNMLAPEEDPWFEHRYGFAGREFDPDTGLYYNRARYYDTLTGRFISKDPIGFLSGDTNLYAYVGNNPVNYSDPTGLTPAGYAGWEVQFVIGYGVATVSCCDGQKSRHITYRKICYGAGFTAGVSLGIAGGSQGASCKNPPPYLISTEFGFPLFGMVGVEGGGAFSPAGGSFFGGGTYGVGGKATVCFYWLVSNTETGCCSQ